MCALSRRLHEKVLFPGRHHPLKGKALGPGPMRRRPKVPAQAASLCEGSSGGTATVAPHPLEAPLRDGLRAASLGLGLARLHLQAGLTPNLPRLLAQIHESIQGLRRQLEREPRPAAESSRPAPASESEACELLASCFG